MKAAWYEKQGAARDVPVVGEMDDPQPRTGEVRIRVAFSGVNPGDVKKREDAFAVGTPYPPVIPHSDGSGTVDAVGDGVSREWVGRRASSISVCVSQWRQENHLRNRPTPGIPAEG